MKRTHKSLIRKIKRYWSDAKRELVCFKYGWQWITRGFPDHHMWSLDYYLAKVIVKRLKVFKDYKKHGTPIFDGDPDFEKFKKEKQKPDGMQIEKLFNGDDWSIAQAYWKEILEKMIWSFEYIINDNCAYNEKLRYRIPIKDCIKLDKQFYKYYEEGMVLFAKYFRNLWD